MDSIRKAYIQMLTEQHLVEATTKSPHMMLATKLASVANSSKPTSSNTELNDGQLHFKTSIKDAQEHKTNDTLKQLGFEKHTESNTGGSTRGDFSSDKYGFKWKHPSGVTAHVYSDFSGSKATFNIKIDGDESDVHDILNK